MIDNEQIAHDLAMVYLHNRYGAEVEGDLEVSTTDGNVSGSGQVTTERLPSVDSMRQTKQGTGEMHLFGLREKKEWVSTGEHHVDGVFGEMIADYRQAYSRFLALLASG